jgi:hypothetical protein
MGKIIIPSGPKSSLSLFLNQGLHYLLQKGSPDGNPGFEALRTHLHNEDTLLHAGHCDDECLELIAFFKEADGSIGHDCFNIPFKENDKNLQLDDVYHIKPNTLKLPSKLFVLDSSLNSFIENLPEPDDQKIKNLQNHLKENGERFITDIRGNTLDLIAFAERPDGSTGARAFQVSWDDNLTMQRIEPIKSEALSAKSQQMAEDIAERLNEELNDRAADPEIPSL